MISRLVTLPLAALALLTLPLAAQEKGQWRAASSTARSITGDIFFTPDKLVINFNPFTLAQIRDLTPEEAAALFPSDVATNSRGTGNLYRVDIPADKRFMHKNTLCGSEPSQWIITWVSGKTLDIAVFSGPSIPTLTREAIDTSTRLCGTYGYTR